MQTVAHNSELVEIRVTTEITMQLNENPGITMTFSKGETLHVDMSAFDGQSSENEDIRVPAAFLLRSRRELYALDGTVSHRELSTILQCVAQTATA